PHRRGRGGGVGAAGGAAHHLRRLGHARLGAGRPGAGGERDISAHRVVQVPGGAGGGAAHAGRASSHFLVGELRRGLGAGGAAHGEEVHGGDARFVGAGEDRGGPAERRPRGAGGHGQLVAGGAGAGATGAAAGREGGVGVRRSVRDRGQLHPGGGAARARGA